MQSLMFSILDFLLLICPTGSVPGKGDASDEDDENEFFDACEDVQEYITVPADPKYHRSLFPPSLLLFTLL